MIWADLILCALSAPLLLAAAYLFALALLARRKAAVSTQPTSWCFDLVVPAHDEEAGIARTVRSLLEVDYPRELRRVLVVADNCQDQTASKAAAAGARVLVRDQPAQRGKGHALAHALEHSLAQGQADAVVVVDADSEVSPNLLSAFAARLSLGEQAVQAGPGVLNLESGWRTRLMAVSLFTFNGLRSLARERLGLSSGLRGNGMCVSHAALRAVPYRAFSLAEDLEYGIALGEAGIRVCYAEEAAVKSLMPSAGAIARSQRRRWERGRQGIARRRARALLSRGLRERNPLLLDLAADLLVPPLSALALAVGALGAASLGVWFLGGHPPVAAALPLSAGTFLGVYVLRGWQLSGTGHQGLLALVWAPFYLLWKLTLLVRRAPEGWVRTAREAPP